MNNLRLSPGFVGLAVLAALPCVSIADTFVLRRDNVVPVVFKDKLTVKDNRPGDTFTVRVTDPELLPNGSELLGRIDRIHPARGNRPASMDLRFTQILLPDHSRVVLDAAPIALDNKYITRTGDGRMVAKQDIRQQQNDILGGAIGGFIVGSIFHRRIAGTIIGTMVGVAAAESSKANDSNVVVAEGDKVGALINQDVRIDYTTIPPRYGIAERLDRGMHNPAMANSIQGRVEIDPALNLTLTFHNRDLAFSRLNRPYRIGKNIMVALEPAASQLGLDVDIRKDRTVYVDGPSSSLRLNMNSRQARLDGKRFDLPRTVVEQNGVVYVPLDALVPLVKDDLFVNGEKFIPVDGG